MMIKIGATVHINLAGLEEIPKEDQNNIKDIIYSVLNASDLPDHEVNLCLVDEETMADLYLRFKNKKKVTDVLSFPVPEMEKTFEHTKNLLGDVVICLDQAKKQAEEYGHTLGEEIAVLAAHGLFHLMGYDHEISKEEADIQMQGEMYLLEKAGFDPGLSLISRV
jgi:probable rRNA maturation factor